MDSDIKFDGNHLHLEGDFIHCKALDLTLDHPDRNKGGGGPLRRALVHDFNDGLTLNWEGDYPGGVTIAGNTINLPALDRHKADSSFSNPVNINVGVQNPHILDKIQIDDQIQTPDIGSVFHELDVAEVFENIESPVNLIREIRRLRSIVLSLDRRLKALEGRS